MNQNFNEHDMVALLHDAPDEGLVAGDIGTIVMVHGKGEAFEVEFPNPNRKPRYIVVTMPRENLLKLHNVDVDLRTAG
jgi:hypothetical protein